LYLPKGKEILSEISFSLEKTKATKIGITGSDGKTTTSTALSQMLENERRTHLVGNIGQPLISQMEKIEKSDFVVCELSSFQLFDYTPTLDAALVTSVARTILIGTLQWLIIFFQRETCLKNQEKPWLILILHIANFLPIQI
jgi:UDP-N-acetylmuramoylalanine-D-glutamate ligase